MHRLDNGRNIRDAMQTAGLSIERLSEKTKEVDPAGYGISPSAIGHMVATGPSGRDTCSRRSADLVALALEKPVLELFAIHSPT
ncbi:helix-turn-helix domain-containing protein [Streptomyces indicus]|uniref:Uncharacterized protein n=1 Tax=Streptomyces indicus TaxID=417292 RepID=A0A1G9IW18_9ACTN|nr:helix-turn-helix transcriptional regulator [Streptomyces indicus]SDL29143.1 hypothetical protein SAMN05421806_12590 [Streptomyces indicus]